MRPYCYHCSSKVGLLVTWVNWCQTAECINMPLGMGIAHGQGHTVLDRGQARPKQWVVRACMHLCPHNNRKTTDQTLM